MSNLLKKANRKKIYNLSSLIRYNHLMHARSENVAEHSFYVALYTMELCRILELSDHERMCAVERAIIHDVHEVVTSDIPHNVKQHFPVIRTELEKFEKMYNDEVFTKHNREYSNLDRKDLIDNIVCFADVLSVLQYAENEISFGNKSFEAVKDDAKERIEVYISRIIGYNISEVAKDEILSLLNSIRTN